MSDLIDRQAAIDALESIGSLDTEADKKYARSVFEALPSVQPETHDKRTKTHACDLIDRQAAIDAAKHAWAKGLEPSQYIEDLPSAQPDIIVCADCKHHSHDADYGRDWCNRMSGVFPVKPDDYCSRAERRDDGN